MARAVTLGNGKVLVGLGTHGFVRDLYYPYVGHTNHVSGASGNYQHRIGVWVDGDFSWLDTDEWDVRVGCHTKTAAGNMCATNERIGVRICTTDVVHNEKDAFIRQLTVSNLQKKRRKIKVFFGQEFRISESRRGDTAFYDPRTHSIIHYKGHVAFVVNAMAGALPFDDFTVGLFGIEGKEGSFRDAEDGLLSKNTIEHGSVDSVIGVTCYCDPKHDAEISYWIAMGESIQEAKDLNDAIIKESPSRAIHSTENYWRAWIGKEQQDFSMFGDALKGLYDRSLGVIRVHHDNRGGIIASSDADMLNQGRDNYSYMWPRDAALVAHALDVAGYVDQSQRFFSYISKLIEPDGYLMHKYRVDGVLGSSWHPWVRGGIAELPIQEDETATCIFALWEHFKRARDVEFLESLYNEFVLPAASFMCSYIRKDTGLPVSSYDLWEEKYGSSTYTAASVYGGLMAAAEIADLLGKDSAKNVFVNTAAQIKKGIGVHLFDEESGTFVKHLDDSGDLDRQDKTIDMSSFFGLYRFGVYSLSDERMVRMFDAVKEKIQLQTETGGFMRYEEDAYYRTAGNPPNPWIITTLWVAQCYIAMARESGRMGDLKPAYEILEWVEHYAMQGGMLPEQLHPHSGAPLSATPLVWSHGEFVITMHAYQEAFLELQNGT